MARCEKVRRLDDCRVETSYDDEMRAELIELFGAAYDEELEKGYAADLAAAEIEESRLVRRKTAELSYDVGYEALEKRRAEALAAALSLLTERKERVLWLLDNCVAHNATGSVTATMYTTAENAPVIKCWVREMVGLDLAACVRNERAMIFFNAWFVSWLVRARDEYDFGYNARFTVSWRDAAKEAAESRDRFWREKLLSHGSIMEEYRIAALYDDVPEGFEKIEKLREAYEASRDAPEPDRTADRSYECHVEVDLSCLGTEKERIAWLLNHCCAQSSRGAVVAHCLVEARDAHTIKSWATQLPDLDDARYEAMTKTRMKVHFGIRLVSWLALKCNEHGFTSKLNEHGGVTHSSRFIASLCMALEEAIEFRKRVVQVRARLVAKLEERDGKKGCVDCGSTGCLDFDHIRRDLKTHEVSTLLWYGAWTQADVETDNCELRCRGCHIKKTMRLGENGRGRRKPISSDPKVEVARARSREKSERGKERQRLAKLERGCCEECEEKCTDETIHNFEWAHIDPMTKRYTVSQMLGCCNRTFFEEIAKCRLLCIECHREETRAAYEIITAKIRATKRKRSNWSKI
jgi:hypothetical protein